MGGHGCYMFNYIVDYKSSNLLTLMIENLKKQMLIFFQKQIVVSPVKNQFGLEIEM
jgi:hypothetical protein